MNTKHKKQQIGTRLWVSICVIVHMETRLKYNIMRKSYEKIEILCLRYNTNTLCYTYSLTVKGRCLYGAIQTIVPALFYVFV